MDDGLLVYESLNGTINIGDYIQSLAARQFIGNNPVYVNREHLDTYRGVKIRLILNGWFMHYPENFPPADNIIPIFLSFHLNKGANRILLDNKNVEYFRQYEPIGCRDLYTMDLLIEKGIKAYFSGCLTLTLGNIYKNLINPRKDIYIVDPYIGHSIKSYISIISCLKQNIRKIYKISTLKYKNVNLSSLIYSALFYHQYNVIWPDEILLNAVYIDHYVKYSNDDEHFIHADEVLKKYADAKLIITSRIHAALPATGMNTPCVFVYSPNQSETDKCRMSGLLELLNVVIHTGVKIENDNQIDVINPKIKNDYLEVKNNLISTLAKRRIEYDT
ncbi:hypothetical protein FACS189444_3450 [Spirochaetia bacterium]|nr:hypothetical protein FACS189444_3450 [Spirochaetia bacterium]